MSYDHSFDADIDAETQIHYMKSFNFSIDSLPKNHVNLLAESPQVQILYYLFVEMPSLPLVHISSDYFFPLLAEFVPLIQMIYIVFPLLFGNFNFFLRCVKVLFFTTFGCYELFFRFIFVPVFCIF